MALVNMAKMAKHFRPSPKFLSNLDDENGDDASPLQISVT
jgi:hypothetical protein